MTPAENNLPWFHPTPGRLLVVLLAVEAILFLSKPWFPKGYALLIAIASVGVTMVLMLIWWLVALCFHWRFQFSLRSLLVATVAVAIPFSWLAVEMKKAREQREAVEAIQKRGGRVEYDIPFTGMKHPPLPVPLQLQRLLGKDFFKDAMQVIFWYTPATDADLKLVEGLHSLDSLYLGDLDNTQVTDNGLKHLKWPTQLKELWLRNTQVTDAGLVHLQRLSNLQLLNLDNTDITDSGLEYLRGLKQLRSLSLSGTNVTDAGLGHFQSLSNLVELDLRNTKVTDQGIKKLQQALPNCKIQH